jgi:hypothetical protein
MHEWQVWAVPALVVLLVPIFAATWKAAERLALLEQKTEQQRTEINNHNIRLEVLDTRLDGQITTLYRVEGKLDALLEGFKALIHFPPHPPKP